MTQDFISREILVVAPEDDRRPLLVDKLSSIGFLVTALTEPNSIKDQLENKFFIVAIFELDTPTTDFAHLLIQHTKRYSPETHCFVLATRESFRSAILSFRVGAKDVVHYDSEEFPPLLDRIKKSATTIAYRRDRDNLMGEMAAVHKLFFKKMLALHIRLMETEAQLHLKESKEEDLPPLNILLVDSEATLINGLTAVLDPASGWNITHCTWGSEALDHGASGSYHVALVNRTLPDLPGTMISSTLKATSPSTRLLMFDYNADHHSLSLFEGSSSQEIPLKGGAPSEVAEKLRTVRSNLASRAQKEEHIKSFKAQNYEFLQNYNRLKTKHQKLMEQFSEDDN